jgi:hypothetical protein
MLAGGLNRDFGRENGQPSILWVCNKCFKYMNEGLPYEIHMVGDCPFILIVLLTLKRKVVNMTIHREPEFTSEELGQYGKWMEVKRK